MQRTTQRAMHRAMQRTKQRTSTSITATTLLLLSTTTPLLLWQADQDAYAASGQKCSAQSMLIAHENWMELGVVEKLAAQAAKLLTLTLTLTTNPDPNPDHQP